MAASKMYFVVPVRPLCYAVYEYIVEGESFIRENGKAYTCKLICKYDPDGSWISMDEPQVVQVIMDAGVLHYYLHSDAMKAVSTLWKTLTDLLQQREKMIDMIDDIDDRIHRRVREYFTNLKKDQG